MGSIPGAVLLREIAEKTIATSYTRERRRCGQTRLHLAYVLGGESKAVKQAVKYTDARWISTMTVRRPIRQGEIACSIYRVACHRWV